MLSRTWRAGRRWRRLSGTRSATIPELVAEPDAGCQERCFFIDDLPPEYRALVYEYGWEIVGHMINDRWPSLPKVEDLEFELMGWRWKRQMQIAQFR